MELEPHFFIPNFLRPVPEAEDDPEIDSESPYDFSNDVSCSTFNLFLGSLDNSRDAARALLGFQPRNRVT